ncbi:MAG: hypothetical protein ACK5LC_06345 [Coprobacillaceae bacterium]
MNQREIKKDCYFDMLEDTIISVESVLNQIQKLENREGMFDNQILQKALFRTYFDLELALANVSILLRKMAENLFITIDSDTRKDINSIIHSNKFDYKNIDCIFVYSQKGKEEVSVKNLISYAKSLFPQ